MKLREGNVFISVYHSVQGNMPGTMSLLVGVPWDGHTRGGDVPMGIGVPGIPTLII